MNIVFSTTRQWNPGDEFILLGCINLLRDHLGEFNPIIFNRHPQIRRSRKRDIIKIIDNLLGKDFIEKFSDNSVKERIDMDYADLVVFAGSPEWRGKRLTKLYDSIAQYNIPALFLGLSSGSGSINVNAEHFTPHEITALQQSELITCRDCSKQDLEDNSYNLNIHNLPCPALFSSKKEKEIHSVKKIALMYGSDKAFRDNNVSQNTYKYLMKAYEFILTNYSDEYQVEFVAHYIDELPLFKKDFPQEVLRYSYDSKDYLDIYNAFDLVIGHRVHGVGIAASMSIPGIMIAHDLRSETVNGFAASKINVGTDLQELKALINSKINNIEEENKKLLKHKNDYKDVFLNLLAGTSIKKGAI